MMTTAISALNVIKASFGTKPKAKSYKNNGLFTGHRYVVIHGDGQVTTHHCLNAVWAELHK
jgi:hypothetical protein